VIPEAVDRGLPVEVVAVYQPSVPIALISFPDEQLNTPKDLEGKKIGISIGEVFANVLEPFAKFNSIDLTKVTVVLAENSVRNAQFSTRKIDVTTVFLNNELPFFEKKLSVRFNVLKIGDDLLPLNAPDFG
jgi:NitT/TauT family transport system substrate-binding protein